MLGCFSRVQLFVTLWIVARQAPLPMGFSRQEYWSGLLCPPPGDLPEPGIKPASPVWQLDSLSLSHPGNQSCHLRDIVIHVLLPLPERSEFYPYETIFWARRHQHLLPAHFPRSVGSSPRYFLWAQRQQNQPDGALSSEVWGSATGVPPISFWVSIISTFSLFHQPYYVKSLPPW